jgi:putative membrane protein
MIENFDEHASNERTFLAWVRTTIAIVGFGIAGARFAGATSAPWADALVLGAGAMVVALAYVRMHIVRRRIDSHHAADDEGTRADLVLAVLVIAFFALLASFGLRLSV